MKIYQESELQTIYETLSEHEHQRELFSWAACVQLYGVDRAILWARLHPVTTKRSSVGGTKLLQASSTRWGDDRLRWMFAIPNEGARHGDRSLALREGARRRSEGRKAGVPDIFLPKPLHGLSGLFIELKRALHGKVSEKQSKFGEYVANEPYGYAVCHGYWEAIRAIQEYLQG